MTALLRRTLVLATAGAALSLLGACATTPAPATLAETAARTPQLSTLSKLISDAGLNETLMGPGPYTVFAPSDEAFKALPAKTLADLAADKNRLKAVLSYHVVPGKLMAADVKTGPLKSVHGANLGLGRAGTFVTVEDALVTQADVAATNGVVHIIDKVMLPPSR
jgi:uncharacterized surface protein with fasciclin (FAS1) repeats